MSTTAIAKRPRRLRLDRKVLDTIAGWYRRLYVESKPPQLSRPSATMPTACQRRCADPCRLRRGVLRSGDPHTQPDRPGIPHAGPAPQYIADTLFRSPQMWFIVSAALPSAG